MQAHHLVAERALSTVDAEDAPEQLGPGESTPTSTPPFAAVVACATAIAPVRVPLDSIGKVVVGQRRVVELMLTALFADGHCLFVGVPGLAKTLLVQTLSQAVGVQFGRIQFTPDLMPSDITGTDVLEEDRTTGRREMRFVQGPVFTNLLLADEINRTPPKTQAALLQAMQEHPPQRGNPRPLREPPVNEVLDPLTSDEQAVVTAMLLEYPLSDLRSTALHGAAATAVVHAWDVARGRLTDATTFHDRLMDANSDTTFVGRYLQEPRSSPGRKPAFALYEALLGLAWLKLPRGLAVMFGEPRRQPAHDLAAYAIDGEHLQSSQLSVLLGEVDLAEVEREGAMTAMTNLGIAPS